MVNVYVICVGKLKEKYLADACNEYIKRMSAFCKLSVIEIQAKRLQDNPSKAEIERALSSEGDAILSKIPQNAFVFSMCIEGNHLSSTEFSQKIEGIGVAGRSNIVFIIGSSYGLSNKVKDCTDFKLSMSNMTFPHQLARVMLLEQIYRAFQISKGGRYHK